MDLKKPLTFDEQLDKLVAHGIVISDKEKAKDILKKVNYYRLTGYALQFRQDPSSSDYKEYCLLDSKEYIIYKKKCTNLLATWEMNRQDILFKEC
jgi:abortive infection bacteriophage resistance protein